MSKRPPLGKLALAGKRNHERQLLDCEQREHDRRDLLSLVGKNSSLAVSSSTSGQGTPSRNERYAARVASAEKARPSSPPAAVVVASVDTNIRAHGITDVVEKIVFDGDGGQPPKTSFELDAVDEESDSGTEQDDADADDSMGSSGSSGGGARMRAERAITKLIDTTQKMIDVKMRLADSMVGKRMCDELRMSVLKMMEKIEKWNEEMEQMMEEKRELNPIVGRVLEHAARSMGLAVPSTNRRTDVTLATVDLGLGVATITTTGGTSKNDDETDLFV